jgi:hypothetical protein
LLGELKQLEALETQRAKEMRAEAKMAKTAGSAKLAVKLADLMLTGS